RLKANPTEMCESVAGRFYQIYSQEFFQSRFGSKLYLTHIWSLRLAEAKIRGAKSPAERTAAAEEHFRTMTRVQKRVEELESTSQKASFSSPAADFYLAEAEQLVVRTKARSNELANGAIAKRMADSACRAYQIY